MWLWRPSLLHGSIGTGEIRSRCHTDQERVTQSGPCVPLTTTSASHFPRARDGYNVKIHGSRVPQSYQENDKRGIKASFDLKSSVIPSALGFSPQTLGPIRSQGIWSIVCTKCPQSSTAVFLIRHNNSTLRYRIVARDEAVEGSRQIQASSTRIFRGWRGILIRGRNFCSIPPLDVYILCVSFPLAPSALGYLNVCRRIM